MKALIVYGSTTSNTETAAESIKNSFEKNDIETTLKNITEVPTVQEYDEYDLIIFGSSTWGFGELQDDWLNINYLNSLDLNGKYIAFFGLGDQMGFSDTFVDAIGLLYNELQTSGATVIGQWSREGYEFSASVALINDKFVGLALDEENQGDLTASRIEQWVTQLITEIK